MTMVEGMGTDISSSFALKAACRTAYLETVNGFRLTDEKSFRQNPNDSLVLVIELKKLSASKASSDDEIRPLSAQAKTLLQEHGIPIEAERIVNKLDDMVERRNSSIRTFRASGLSTEEEKKFRHAFAKDGEVTELRFTVSKSHKDTLSKVILQLDGVKEKSSAKHYPRRGS